MPKASDHPEYFRLAPPEGRSRESTLVLDCDGRFWHEGERVDRSRLHTALFQWISRHPDNGRFILNNGYDWTYFRVELVPFFVLAVHPSPEGPVLHLSDDTKELWRSERVWEGESGSLFTEVKHEVIGGPFEAKFLREAQLDLADYLETSGDGTYVVRLGASQVPIQSAK